MNGSALTPSRYHRTRVPNSLWALRYLSVKIGLQINQFFFNFSLNLIYDSDDDDDDDDAI